jgi:hypothetical protein
MKYWISEVGILHVFPELLKVFLLLCKLLLELQELLLLAHANSVVLTGLLALGECTAYPEAPPPDLGAPVSPADIARTVVENAARD